MDMFDFTWLQTLKKNSNNTKGTCGMVPLVGAFQWWFSELLCFPLPPIFLSSCLTNRALFHCPCFKPQDYSEMHSMFMPICISIYNVDTIILIKYKINNCCPTFNIINSISSDFFSSISVFECVNGIMKQTQKNKEKLVLEVNRPTHPPNLKSLIFFTRV